MDVGDGERGEDSTLSNSRIVSREWRLAWTSSILDTGWKPTSCNARLCIETYSAHGYCLESVSLINSDLSKVFGFDLHAAIVYFACFFYLWQLLLLRFVTSGLFTQPLYQDWGFWKEWEASFSYPIIVPNPNSPSVSSLAWWILHIILRKPLKAEATSTPSPNTTNWINHPFLDRKSVV